MAKRYLKNEKGEVVTGWRLFDIEDDIDSKLLNSLLINESDDDDAEALEIDDLLKALQEEETAATIEEPVPEPTIEEGDDEEIILDDDFLLNDLDVPMYYLSLFQDHRKQARLQARERTQTAQLIWSFS